MMAQCSAHAQLRVTCDCIPAPIKTKIIKRAWVYEAKLPYSMGGAPQGLRSHTHYTLLVGKLASYILAKEALNR